ncbi:MAG: hypothetical protein PHN56_07355 [Candidatus Nanoarchaeia archaeon]|nr:hypothetical protein [Candidatus Nanoarchaeia archaeon]
MPMIVDENLEKVLGSEWVNKYHSALSKKTSKPKIVFENKIEEKEFMQFIQHALSPETAQTTFKKNGFEYDVLVVNTPSEIRVFPLKFGNSVSFRFKNDWIGGFVDESEIEKLVPDNNYLLVGNYYEKKGSVGDRIFKNMRVDFIMSFAELAEGTFGKDAPEENNDSQNQE